MRLIRIALMGLGIYYVGTFILNFFQTLDQNQRYLQVKSTLSQGIESVQAGISNSLQSVEEAVQTAQANVVNSIENVQTGSTNLVSQFDDNALLIMLVVLFLLFIMRRALKRAS